MRYSVMILVVFCSLIMHSQPASNTELLKKTEFKNAELEYKRHVEYLFKHKKWYVKYNPVSLFFGGMLYFYQKNVSGQIGAACPYEVSCSGFSKAVIQRYGIIKGIALTADRLTRCTRFSIIDLNENTELNRKTHKIIDDPADYKLKGSKSIP